MYRLGGTDLTHEADWDWKWIGSKRVISTRGHGSRLGGTDLTHEADWDWKWIGSKRVISTRGHGSRLGGTDLTHEADCDWDWKWIGSKRVISTRGHGSDFSDWSHGEPSNSGGGDDEDCLTIMYSHSFQWDDRQCGDVFRFVCEIGDVMSRRMDTIPVIMLRS
nr:hypothetical protein BaRGS_022330 [Batillaria attramentaria]